MSALPVDASIIHGKGLNVEFVKRVLGAREAKRLASLFEDAEARARERIDQATREAEEIFAHARDEARQILEALPNFAELQARPYGSDVMRAIRNTADRYGLSQAAVTGRSREPEIVKARTEAILAIIRARPTLSDASIAHLFSKMSPDRIRQIRRDGAA